MSWSKCLYQYQREKGGQFMGDFTSAALVITHRDRPLVLRWIPGTRDNPVMVEVCGGFELERRYDLFITAAGDKLGGVSKLFGAGYSDRELGRTVRSLDLDFTRRVLSDPELRAALLASPNDTVSVNFGPGTAHLLTVRSYNPQNAGSDWPLCAVDSGLGAAEYPTEVIREQFYPRLERLLGLVKAVHDAVTRWK